MATSINAVQWNTPYKQVPPSYNTQQNQLMKVGWDSMAGYGQSPNMYVPPVFPVSKAGAGRGGQTFLGDKYNDALRASSRLGRQPPTPTRPPVRHNPNSAYGVNSTAVDGTSIVTQPMAAMNAVMPASTYNPTNINYGFNTNDQLAGMAGLSIGRDQLVNGAAPFFGSRTLGELPTGSGGGTDTSWWDNLLGKGKETWNNNKDWLVGDKNSIGAIPLGLGLFNAFNQYTLGRESIKSMREQNALARESFALNKAGALASLEDQYNKRNSNDMYHRNPKLSYADNVAAASSKTLEDMKRFK